MLEDLHITIPKQPREYRGKEDSYTEETNFRPASIFKRTPWRRSWLAAAEVDAIGQAADQVDLEETRRPLRKALALLEGVHMRRVLRWALLLAAGATTLCMLSLPGGLLYRVACEQRRRTLRPAAPPRVYDAAQRFHVLRAYVPSRRSFPAEDSASSASTVTLCTHGDHAHLGHLGELASRWRGPVSVAVYAPGDDVARAADAIAHARSCLAPPLVADLVTFHVFFERAAARPGSFLHGALLARRAANCSAVSPWGEHYPHQSYRSKHGLQYPVNVARNIARYCASTHYVLVSDIEMYPSENIIPRFLHMVQKEPRAPVDSRPRVYVLPDFEVRHGVVAPRTKDQLVNLLRRQQALPFHQKLCAECHAMPRLRQWMSTRRAKEGMSVSAVVTRQGQFRYWEPVYIGTKREPPYDERFTWEGQQDRMVQAFEMCALCYEFHVLDNAFMVHAPGLKNFNRERDRSKYVQLTKRMVETEVLPEMRARYPTSSHCYL